MNPYWSYLLTAVGVFGLYLAGKKDRRGWILGIFAQVLWIAYATATQQYGFYISALAYGWVYAKNARAWKTPRSQGKRIQTPMSWIRSARDEEAQLRDKLQRAAEQLRRVRVADEEHPTVTIRLDDLALVMYRLDHSGETALGSRPFERIRAVLLQN